MRGEAFFFRLAQVVSAKPRKRLQPPERAGYLVVATCLVTKAAAMPLLWPVCKLSSRPLTNAARRPS